MIDFYFDPICPWCWITSRWLREVAPQRDLTVRWRSFSLHVKNYEMEGGHGKEDARGRYWQTHQALRVIEAVRMAMGDEIVDALYLEYGRRYHHDRERPVSIEDWVTSAGLDASWIFAADEPRWDATIRASMDEALRVTGPDVGVPIIVFDGVAGFFGPVVSPAPTGEAALELFDHVEYLARAPWFHELKRMERGRADVGARPEPLPG